MSKRELRDCIFFWTERSVIRFFRKNFEKKHYKNLRSVYMALCEINSDFGEKKKIGGFTKTVSTYAGLGADTASVYLRALKAVRIIDYQQDTENKGKFGKTELHLYKWEKESANLVSNLMDAINKINSPAKKPSTENTGNGKQRQRKKPVYKNTSTKVEVSSSFKKKREGENFFPSLYKLFKKNFLGKKELYINYLKKNINMEDVLSYQKGGYSDSAISIDVPAFIEVSCRMLYYMQLHYSVQYTDSQLIEGFNNMYTLLSANKVKMAALSSVVDWYGVAEHREAGFTTKVKAPSALVLTAYTGLLDSMQSFERNKNKDKSGKKRGKYKIKKPVLTEPIMPKPSPEPEFSPVQSE